MKNFADIWESGLAKKCRMQRVVGPQLVFDFFARYAIKNADEAEKFDEL